MWRSLDGMDVDVEAIEIYGNLLEERRIRQSGKKDELIWVASNDGNYSVKNG